MEKKIACMLRLQDETNRRLAEDWTQRDWHFRLAAKVEAAELADHLSYKWWKLKKPDMPQARMEVVDIWHFVMSAILRDAPNIAAPSFIADTFRQVGSKVGTKQTPEEAVLFFMAAEGPYEMLEAFVVLCDAVGLSFLDLYFQYVGKAALNRFRWNNGYADDTYVKIWDGREDNEWLTEILNQNTASLVLKEPDDMLKEIEDKLGQLYRP